MERNTSGLTAWVEPALLMLLLAGWSALAAGQVTGKTTSPSQTPGLVVFSGGRGDALGYSLDHDDCVTIALLTGTETIHSGHEVARAIKNKIFSGHQEAPVAVFVDPKPTPEKADIVMVVYLRGHRFRDDHAGANILDAKALKDCAGQIVNKLRNPARRVDKENALSGDW